MENSPSTKTAMLLSAFFAFFDAHYLGISVGERKFSAVLCVFTDTHHGKKKFLGLGDARQTCHSIIPPPQRDGKEEKSM